MYEAATHKYLRTIQLGGDQTTELFVVPAAPRRGDRLGALSVPSGRPARRDAEAAPSPRQARDAATPTCVGRSHFWSPYWRRLVLVMVISLVSTGLSLVTPYLSKDLVDRALVGRDLTALRRIVGSVRAARRG